MDQVPARARVSGRLREHPVDLVGQWGGGGSWSRRGAGLSWLSTPEVFLDQADPVLGVPLAPVRVLGIEETRRGRPGPVTFSV